MLSNHLTRLAAPAALILLLLSAVIEAPVVGAGLSGVSPMVIKVSFKLDQRLTRAQYMGDLWVSPPTFTSTLREGTELTVEARVEGADSQGKPVKISPEWKPEDPDMVAVSPVQGNEVKITVKRAGQSSLEVVSSGVIKKLSIKATAMHEGKALQVEITQTQ